MAQIGPEDLQGPIGESIAEHLRSHPLGAPPEILTVWDMVITTPRGIQGFSPNGRLVFTADPFYSGIGDASIRPEHYRLIRLSEAEVAFSIPGTVAPSHPDPLTILSRLALDRPPGELTFEEMRAGIVGLTLRKDGREVKGIVDLDLMTQSGGDYEKSLRQKIARMER